MTFPSLRPTLVALLCLAVTPSFAESLAASASSAASSASSAGSASLRGSSDSISGSSDTTRRNGDVAEGDYRVASVDGVDGRPEMLRLTLEPVAAGADASGFRLDLPRRALGDRPFTPGDTVSARHRPYGLEFARGKVADAFFLVLADDWHRDLQTRVLAN
jgi:hypothetical protein